MEQLVARRAHNPKVIGSSPVPATQVKSLLEKSERLFAFGRFARLAFIRVGHRIESCSRYPSKKPLREI
jgi:hypothetical protein